VTSAKAKVKVKWFSQVKVKEKTNGFCKSRKTKGHEIKLHLTFALTFRCTALSAVYDQHSLGFLVREDDNHALILHHPVTQPSISSINT